MDLLLTGVPGSAQVTLAQLPMLLFCLLELLLELWLGKHSRPKSHHDCFCTKAVQRFPVPIAGISLSPLSDLMLEEG